jgi:hypothetical protein
VAFPFTDVAAGWSYAGCPRDMVLARADMAAAARRVRAAIDQHGTGHRPLAGEDLESLLGVLEGQMPGQISLLSWAEENEAYVDQLTRDRAKVARILREQRRLKVIGGVGTGKTWLALEQARHLAARGERVALVCYLPRAGPVPATDDRRVATPAAAGPGRVVPPAAAVGRGPAAAR